jgi:hypothetical protein
LIHLLRRSDSLFFLYLWCSSGGVGRSAGEVFRERTAREDHNLLPSPRRWNPDGYDLPRRTGSTQAINLADLGHGVPRPHGAGYVASAQPQRQPDAEREATTSDPHAHQLERASGEQPLRAVDRT